MGLKVDIDSNSGFCAGVIRAIDTAQKQLDSRKKLFSLGEIVHNEAELERLGARGLVTIDKEDLEDIVDASGEGLLIRAHGEPPGTYAKAKAKGFEVIDCTCPVVLKLQQEIKRCRENGQIVIFGKVGHAEVLGLVGQTDGEAVVVENEANLDRAIADGSIDTGRRVEIFSQTTKSPTEYSRICQRLSQAMDNAALLHVHDSICIQVATRHEKLARFATEHDIIVFVSSKASSNGKVLCDLCKTHNIRTYLIGSKDEIKSAWFRPEDKVGVCGATSTPKWLLEEIAQTIQDIKL